MREEVVNIRPQAGFQTKVALSRADITIIGGAAGCGKSFIMLYLPLMYKDDPGLRVAYFRQTQAQIRQSGSLWDESTKLYPLFGAEPSESILKWRFPSGGIIDFEGIQFEKDLLNFQGAAIPFILFDELTQFSKSKFIFMISRNRGIFKRGVKGHLQKPQIFGSCNPDPDSWVAGMIEWYIDQETGYPIPEREGIVRYFMVIEEKFVWADSKADLIAKYPEQFEDESFKLSGLSKETLIKSFTFIGGKIYDNKKLLQSNPGYLSSLMSQTDADKERFLKGNWKVRPSETGLYQVDKIDLMFKDKLDEETRIALHWEKDVMVTGIDYDYQNNFITCDAAKFGRDLCVIMVWKKWTVVHTTIFYLSAPREIKDEIELLRNDFKVLRKNVCVDQDGVGGDVVQLGGYYGFMARRECAMDEVTKEKENYVKRKDQCFFRSAARLNRGEINYIILPSTVKIYDKGSKHPRWSFMLKWNNEMINIKTLISKQLRAIKRGANVDMQGGDLKLCTNTKEEQKEILGHSPDFADNIMMREDLELRPKRSGSFRSW